jgi:HD-GYP domain-containing protein (c-di-GMP phosphodiesterase class II)
MHLTLETIIPLAAVFSYLLLFIVVYLSKPQNALRSRFRLYLLAMVIWSIAAFIVLQGLGITVFWFRLMTSSALASMIALFYFTQAAVTKKIRIAPLIYIYGLAAILINQFTTFVTIHAEIISGELVFENSQFIGVVAGPAYLIMLFSIFQLLWHTRTARDETQFSRYSLFAVAIIIILIGGSLNFTELGKYPVDILANIIAALIITYAILRHQLLDINVVIRKSLLYAIPTALVGVVYFLFISLALQIFSSNAKENLFSISLIVSILAALVVQPFRDYLQNTIDKFFFRERYNTVQMLQRVSRAASSVINLDELTFMILNEITAALHVQKAAIFLKYNGKKNLMVATQLGTRISPRTVIEGENPLVHWLNLNDFIVTQQELETDTHFRALWGEERNIINQLGAEIFIPLNAKGELVGLIALGPKLSEQAYSNDDKQTLLTLAHQTAIAVQNAQLYSSAQQELKQRRETEKRLQLQLKRLSALQNINIAITTNIDLQIPLYLLLEQVTEELGMDAADVLLFDEENQQLSFVAGRGFQTDALRFTKLELGQGLAGKAAETLKVIHVKDLRLEKTSLINAPLLPDEDFITYFGVPLISKGKVQGVLELFHRTVMEPDDDWMNFLNTLTSETAVAVDNAHLFRDLEKSNLDLVAAYETTLEGWAKTLELRDRETEGHSQRVMDLATRLSRKLGVEEDELVHIQRGAVLHDIGKMGIPDNILLKEGTLTEKEWEVMRKHPEFAFNMLSTIPFLKKASDIPYCHHEKWDGTGYPRGLKGEEIPLGARIFALVDVWDALRSDRPYRKAWTDSDARDYITKQSGMHFDPIVVKAFDEIMELEKRSLRKNPSGKNK